MRSFHLSLDSATLIRAAGRPHARGVSVCNSKRMGRCGILRSVRDFIRRVENARDLVHGELRRYSGAVRIERPERIQGKLI